MQYYGPSERNVRVPTLILMLCSLYTAAPADTSANPHETVQNKPAPKKKATPAQSMTGCVDEQDGGYVLLDDRMLNKLAELEAVGAPNEAVFAKHMGHKVTVKGNKSSEQGGKFRVTSIEDISSVCAPAQPSPQ